MADKYRQERIERLLQKLRFYGQTEEPRLKLVKSDSEIGG